MGKRANKQDEVEPPLTQSSSSKRGRKKSTESSEEVTDQDTRNFLTQVKNPKGANQGEKAIVWEMYSGMSRFDAEKKDLIEKWKKDKSCKWHQDYAHLRTKKEACLQERMDGFGTK